MTRTQLDDFHAFAVGELENGCADLTLEELLRQWRDREEMCEAIRIGLENLKAGRGLPLQEVIDEIRRELESSETV